MVTCIIPFLVAEFVCDGSGARMQKGKFWDKSRGPNRRGARPTRKGKSSPPAKERMYVTNNVLVDNASDSEDGRDAFLEEQDSDKRRVDRGGGT
jgi:hypothetical protein